MNDIRESMTQQGLIRTRDDKVIAGVCSGLGRRIGLGPWTARLVFVLLVVILPGFPILVYPLLWILMPKEQEAQLWTPAAPPVAPSA